MFLFINLVLIGVATVILLSRKDNTPSSQTPTSPEVTSIVQERMVRQAAVAGSFYPKNVDELSNQLDAFLNKADKVAGDGTYRILFVPHAGIEYSGQMAARAFKQIKGENYKKVILLGVSHQVYFDHAAIYAEGSWQTPLGEVEVNKTLAQALVSTDQNIRADVNPHEKEHSLEVELIFLQKVLKNFTIVPVLVSNSSEQLISDLAQRIAKNFDEETLLVVSTDLSHYPDADTARQVDGETIEAILTGKQSQFKQKLTQLTTQYSNVDTFACGAKAVEVGLRVSELLGFNDYIQLGYENSGDVTGDVSRVVGYGAIGIKGKIEKNDELSELAKYEALDIARKTLESYFEDGKVTEVTSTNLELSRNLGAFVTLHKHGELRGCIGEFEPSRPLYKVIQNMAVAAATKDTRFQPVTKDELPEIEIEISVMTPKKKISNWREINLGKDGVVVQKGSQSGTFLPQVATETGWNLEEFLGELCSQKAGLPNACYLDPEVSLYTFSAQVFKEG